VLFLLLKMLFTSESLSLFRGIVCKFLIFSWAIGGNISVYFKCFVSYRCSRELSLIYFTEKPSKKFTHKNDKEKWNGKEKNLLPALWNWSFCPQGSLLLLKYSYQRRTNDLLTRSSKTNYERTTGELTIWLTIDNCLTVTIDGSKRTNYWLRVFIANNITA